MPRDFERFLKKELNLTTEEAIEQGKRFRKRWQTQIEDDIDNKQ